MECKFITITDKDGNLIVSLEGEFNVFGDVIYNKDYFVHISKKDEPHFNIEDHDKIKIKKGDTNDLQND